MSHLTSRLGKKDERITELESKVQSNMKLYAGADEIIRNECCKFVGIIIDYKLGWLHRRTGQHPFGGSNRVLPEWRTQLLCHAAPPGRKKYQSTIAVPIFDGRRLVPDEHLLCYPTRNVSQVLFRTG